MARWAVRRSTSRSRPRRSSASAGSSTRSCRSTPERRSPRSQRIRTGTSSCRRRKRSTTGSSTASSSPGRPAGCAVFRSLDPTERTPGNVPARTYTSAPVDHLSVLVRGIGDIGSAVAHRLFGAGHLVVIHDVLAPAAARRGMAFTDALFDGPVVLEGITCRRIEQLSELAEASGASGELFPREGGWIAAATLPLEDVVDSLRPAVLVDARMRKRAVPEPQRHLAALTIGLGPNFVAGETTDLVVETSWGERLGTVLTEGSPAPLAGEPRTYGGHARDRFVYAPAPGMFRTTAVIG